MPQDEASSALVVSREMTIEPGEHNIEETQKELEELPFSFAKSMGSLLASSHGRELLTSSRYGLRGQVMHGGTGWILPILRNMPCVVDCLECLVEAISPTLCCRTGILRISPAAIS